MASHSTQMYTWKLILCVSHIRSTQLLLIHMREELWSFSVSICFMFSLPLIICLNMRKLLGTSGSVLQSRIKFTCISSHGTTETNRKLEIRSLPHTYLVFLVPFRIENNIILLSHKYIPIKIPLNVAKREKDSLMTSVWMNDLEHCGYDSYVAFNSTTSVLAI